jgi:F-type H+-transporting ATPase subunit delta
VNESLADTVKVGPVAARYAFALYQLAKEKGELEAVTRDVAQLALLLDSEAQSSWIFDARVPAREKRERIERLALTLAPITANFLRLVADKRRLELLRELPAAFKRCALRGRNAVEGRVESARPMAPGELAELCVSLGQVLGKEVTLRLQVEPSLLAGARIYVDNRMLDVSAQGRLEGLRTHLNSARLR